MAIGRRRHRADDANLRLCTACTTWTATPGTQENLPINCVNWYEAYAFCIWDGGFLPSEAEWEYAAAGGSQQREYPWGSTDPGTANQYAIYGCYYPPDAGGYPPDAEERCSYAQMAPVGTAWLGAGRWGQMDMVGEASEWNADWWYGDFGLPSACLDCAYLTGGTSRVFEGCDEGCSAEELLFSLYLSSSGPSITGGTVGLRCARSP